MKSLVIQGVAVERFDDLEVKSSASTVSTVSSAATSPASTVAPTRPSTAIPPSPSSSDCSGLCPNVGQSLRSSFDWNGDRMSAASTGDCVDDESPGDTKGGTPQVQGPLEVPTAVPVAPVLQSPKITGLIWEKSLQRFSTRALTASEDDNVANNLQQQQETCATERILRKYIDRNREEAIWENLEDDIFILLCGNTAQLNAFRELHSTHRLTRSSLLASTAYIVSHRQDPSIDSLYYDCVSIVTAFLVSPTLKVTPKRALLQTIIRCRSPAEAMWQWSDRIIEETLDFILSKEYEWEYPPHSEIVLLSELRAMCRFCLDKEERQRQLVEEKGDAAIIFISGCAKLIEVGISDGILPVVCTKLDDAVETCKDSIKPNADPLMVSQDAVVALTYTNAAKETSESVRENTKEIVEKIKNLAEMGFAILATTADNNSRLVELVLPHAATREMIKVAGRVCVTMIGAVAIVGEATIHGSRAVIQKTAHATADIIEHKYGSSVAQVLRDAGDTAGNVMGAFGHVAFLKARVVAKAVARQSGKNKVNEEADMAAQTLKSAHRRSREMIHCLARGKSPGSVLILGRPGAFAGGATATTVAKERIDS